MRSANPNDPSCHRFPRRAFLADLGMGFTGLVLGSMLQRDGVARASDDPHATLAAGLPHFAPTAKRVIWLFMIGGVSHMESFDPKPELTKYAGKTIAESPYKHTLDSPHLKKNLRQFEALCASNPRLEIRVIPGADHGLRTGGALVPGVVEQAAEWISKARRP